MSLSRNIIIILLLSTQSFSQNNHVYVELLGPGLMASVNYERNLDNNIFVRAGYGYFSVESTTSGYMSSSTSKTTINPLILGAHYVRGLRGNWKLDAGVGISYWMIKLNDEGEGTTLGDLSFETKGSYPMGYGSLGIRYQKPGEGVSLKLGVSPTIAKIGEFTQTLVFPHISIGYSFE
jgi:hypothetical protein